ncbi:MAG: LPP20 family lipoprotein [Elusimicrobia bacterium]|nr:LPP20 family lipoprotein [Elusimicrobiota bacterium]
MSTKTLLRQSVLAVAGLALFACGGPKQPEWIMKGAGAFKDRSKTFYGVGIAEGIQSEALRRTTADNRAIAEISKQLTVMSTSLMRDYMSSTSIPAEAKGNEEQYIENTIKTFTDNVISGVQVIDRYQDKSGTLYSLASLNLDTLTDLAGKVKGLSQGVRDHIKANAESAFDKLNEEQSKRSDQ